MRIKVTDEELLQDCYEALWDIYESNNEKELREQLDKHRPLLKLISDRVAP